jgi:hypothetical protein
VNEIEQNGKLFQLNKIVTSKYTVINFLPKNLIDQFSKLANIYFLAMMVLQVSASTNKRIIDHPFNFYHQWAAYNFASPNVCDNRLGYQGYIRRP